MNETEKLSTTAAGRSAAIDLVKALAVYCVIIVHSCYYGYENNAVGSLNWLSAVFWGSAARAGVPLFLMCSGALMLSPRKELPMKKLFLHNLLRVVVAMLVWSMAYKIYHLTQTGFSAVGLWQGFKETLLLNQDFHFYYLHIIILVYLFLPLTRAFVKAADKRLLRYALGLWFAVGILYPTVRPYWPFNLLFGIPVQWMINMTYAAIGYGLLGHYIREYPARGFVYAAAGVLGFALVFGGTWYMSVQTGELFEDYFECMTVGVCLMAYGIFGGAVCVGEKLPGWIKKAAGFLSGGSFCVYLAHVYFLYTLRERGLTVDILPCIVSIPLIALCNLLLCLVLYAVLKRVPLVRRWLI